MLKKQMPYPTAHSILFLQIMLDIPVDSWGRVISRRKFGIIKMEIETVPNVVILHNILSTNDVIEGNMVFYTRFQIPKMLEVNLSVAM
ncbi:MAG: hypothetical protein IPP29_16945 [Bacteroidetes bacterium]|nr:hypothetical protein [Bacteroidota bacterium]